MRERYSVCSCTSSATVWQKSSVASKPYAWFRTASCSDVMCAYTASEPCSANPHRAARRSRGARRRRRRLRRARGAIWQGFALHQDDLLEHRTTCSSIGFVAEEMTAVRLTLMLAVWRARGATERPIIAIAAHPAASSAPACGGSCEQVVARASSGSRRRAAARSRRYAERLAHRRAARAGQRRALPGSGGPPGRSGPRGRGVARARRARRRCPVGHVPRLRVAARSRRRRARRRVRRAQPSLPLALEPAARARACSAAARTPRCATRSRRAHHVQQPQAELAPDEFAASAALRGNFTVLSTNADRGGRPFVSTMEHDAACPSSDEWHPEKAQFEWGANADGTPFRRSHAPSAVAARSPPNLRRVRAVDARVRDARGRTGRALLNFAPTSTTPEFEQTYFLHL